MARILVLGGGRQGRIVADDLAVDHEVTLADVAAAPEGEQAAWRRVRADLQKPMQAVGLMREHDLVVGALPARLGFGVAGAAIEAKRNYVDITSYTEDASRLHAKAQHAGIAIMPDCGAAPGLSSFIAGRAIKTRNPSEVHIRVGGVAADPKRPYGYVITWSPESLLDQYLRPARIIRDGQVTEVPALSGVETVNIPGVGAMEAFFTDGLRTLLSSKVRNMTEKTVRWPGHAEAVRPLLASGRLVQELTAKCSEGDDVVVLRVQADKDVVTMVERARDGVSAMARVTALTCAAFARWVATGKMAFTGLVPPERLAADHEAYQFVIDTLRVRGIAFEPSYPFVRPM